MVLRVALAIVLVAHGIGHVLFLAPALRLVDWGRQTGESWLLTDLLGDPLTRAIAAVGWATATVLFLVGAFGLLSRSGWWRVVVFIAALVSLVAIVGMWDGIATSNAFLAAVVDVVVVGAIVRAIWPAAKALAP